MVVTSRRTGAGGQTLADRARRHAALGEPARLAIVDHLILGDASPGELGTLVGLPTNLLAHHLRVLEDAALVRRVRSEGDRRRSYVQLRLDDADVAGMLGATSTSRSRPAFQPGAQALRVVFVCTHNSARSQLAAAAWARVSDRPAASAGTHPAARVHPRAVAVGRRHGLRLGQARTSSLGQTLRPGDLLVAVCDNAHEELAATDRPPWLHWAVPDPVRVDTDAAFETAYDHLVPRIERLIDALDRPRHAS